MAQLRVSARERERPAVLVAEPHAPGVDLQDLRLAASDQVRLAGMAGMPLRGLPLTFGRRGYCTGFVARRSTGSLKLFHAPKQTVCDAVLGQHTGLPEQRPMERESVVISRPLSPLERTLFKMRVPRGWRSRAGTIRQNVPRCALAAPFRPTRHCLSGLHPVIATALAHATGGSPGRLAGPRRSMRRSAPLIDLSGGY